MDGVPGDGPPNEAFDDQARAKAALDANVAGYDAKTASRVVAGSPHLKFRRLRELYSGLVEATIEESGRLTSELSVLELGAGDGLSSLPWLERRVPLTAVDPSSEMLARLAVRAAGAPVKTVLADAVSFVKSAGADFDVVCFVSMLHHIPDYVALLQESLSLLRPNGSFITFQDPLRYDHLAPLVHPMDRALYFSWRVGQGDFRRGLSTRWRRLRHKYVATEISDFEEYHVVRNGVDSDAIIRALRPHFMTIRELRYWSNQARWGQMIGESLRLKNTFAVLALGSK